jgi:hypothetical protein
MARLLGGRIVGLPNYFVVHGTSPSLQESSSVVTDRTAQLHRHEDRQFHLICKKNRPKKRHSSHSLMTLCYPPHSLHTPTA